MSKLLILIVAVVALLSFSGTASGARPAHAGPPPITGAISLDQPAPSLGDVVTFTITTSKQENCKHWGGPVCYRIELVCSQSGVPVYVGDANADQQFLLGGGISQWVTNGGPADCEATLYTYTDFNPVTRRDLAVASFAAGG